MAELGRETAQDRVRFRGGGFAPGQRRGPALLVFAALIAFWQGGSSLGWINPLFLPSPAHIAQALYDVAASGELWRHFTASLGRILGGWAIGTAAGLALGTAMGLFTLARSIGMPLVSAIFPVPKIALLPLFILWFGIGEPSKLATIALGVFFPTVINCYSGIDGVARNLIRMAQSFDLPPRDIVRKVVLPGAMPTIIAGFRISSSVALILVVAAEMIGAEYGLGAFVLQAGHLMATDQLLAGVVCLSVLGLIFGAAITALERSLLRWR
ncbi:ABC transporter permease [Pelagibius sp.]|uniref:ABC transporter permease n=1 Tax=Pelagibius sp. TaxID=1931238 RepID=UPI0026056752|nr:ABC transporter permease [Pelagibius sp.]